MNIVSKTVKIIINITTATSTSPSTTTTTTTAFPECAEIQCLPPPVLELSFLLCRLHMLTHFRTGEDSLLKLVIRSPQQMLLKSQNRLLLRKPDKGTGESCELLLPCPWGILLQSRLSNDNLGITESHSHHSGISLSAPAAQYPNNSCSMVVRKDKCNIVPVYPAFALLSIIALWVSGMSNQYGGESRGWFDYPHIQPESHRIHIIKVQSLCSELHIILEFQPPPDLTA